MCATKPLRENEWTLLSDLRPDSNSSARQKIANDLSGVSARIKKDLGLRRSPFTIERRGGHDFVRATGIAGTVVIGSCQIDIVPKFFAGVSAQQWRASTLALIARAARGHFVHVKSVRLATERSSFVDHVALAFRDALEEALRGAPIQIYSVREEQSTYLRGRFAVDRHLRGVLNRPQIVECDVDYLETDNSFNRLLHWAGHKLTRLTWSPAIRRRLGSTMSKLPPVRDSQRGPGHIPSEAPSQYRHFDDALDIAYALAKGQALGHSVGLIAGYGYVLDMERLYESFLEKSLGHVLSRIEADVALAQPTQLYAAALTPSTRSYYTRPDNILKRAGDAVLLVDAKYKNLFDAEDLRRISRPLNSDIYQLVASLASHACSRGLLIYPLMVSEGSIASAQLRYWKTSTPEGNFLLAAVAMDISDVGGKSGMAQFDNELVEIVRSVLEYPI